MTIQRTKTSQENDEVSSSVLWHDTRIDLDNYKKDERSFLARFFTDRAVKMETQTWPVSHENMQARGISAAPAASIREGFIAQERKDGTWDIFRKTTVDSYWNMTSRTYVDLHAERLADKAAIARQFRDFDGFNEGLAQQAAIARITPQEQAKKHKTLAI
jgi:hypothetical protein